MNLRINGEPRELAETRTLRELLKELKYEGQNFAVAVNRRFIPRNDYDKTTIKEQDEVEILMPLQGG